MFVEFPRVLSAAVTEENVLLCDSETLWEVNGACANTRFKENGKRGEGMVLVLLSLAEFVVYDAERRKRERRKKGTVKM